MWFEVSLFWEELEFILITLIPTESNDLISIILELEALALLFSDDAISDLKLIIWESFESDTFRITFSRNHNLMLLIWIVQSCESQQECFILSLFWRESDIKALIRFWSNGMAQIS
jgi:hypothetical protein